MRQFRYEGNLWEVAGGGSGVGFGSAPDRIPDADTWFVTFRCLSDPSRGDFGGHVRGSRLEEIGDAQLRRALERAIGKAVR